jgi:protein tyrosine phosphatase
MTISSTTKGPNHVPVIVGVVVGVGGGLIVIAIIILLILLRRRTWQRKDEGLRPVPDKRPERHDSDMDSLHPFNPLPDRPVPIPELLQYVADHQGNMTRYKDEFERLPGPNIGLRKAAKDSANKDKNRYLNIKPYDDNRVQLFTHEEGNGYINASFIDGKKRQKAFIASQGPQEATVADFWLMVWEQKCTKIVMVTNVMEGFKVKCTQYWPKDTRTIQTFGKFKISLVSEMVDYDYTVRKLSIQKAGEPERTLTHYHFTEWPDHAVPETCTSLLKFHNAIFSDMSASDQPVAPIIVHCSAGVGRSGTLISVNFLLQQAAETSQIDIFKCIETLRLQRMYMVQTVAQYIYIHHVMLEALLLGDVTCPASNFADEYQRLSQPVTPHTKSLIQLQFDVLEALKPNYSTDLYAIARSTENASRNRSLDVLPVEPHMVCLRPTLEDKNTYINAVRVNGYHRKEPPYIVTQMPLASTASDFWRLAQDNSCVAIIMLNDLDNNNSSEQYWPADGQSVVVGKFTVTNIGPEISSNNILATNLRVTYSGKLRNDSSDDGSDDEDDDDDDENSGDNKVTDDAMVNPVYANLDQIEMQPPKGKSFVVRHMRVLKWMNNRAFPADMSTLLSLYSETVKCQQKNPNGCVIFHCLNGAERSGLCCAMMNMMDQLEADHEVNVYDSVKRVRQAQPKFVKTIDDYQYLYQLALHHQTLAESGNNHVQNSVLYSNINDM